MAVADRLAAADYTQLKVSLDEKILTVRINRPEVLGALSPEVIHELRDVFAALRSSLGERDDAQPDTPDWSVRGVIVTGVGERAFVAGADIATMREMSAAEARAYAAATQELTVWIETLPVPVIAAVNGFALGGGCELAMACDYIFASENASFGQPEVALGLIPGFGGTVRLARYVGLAAARELIMTGRRIDASTAHRLGLVAQVFPDVETLLAASKESLRLTVAQSPAAVASAKRAITAVQQLPLQAALDYECAAFAARFGTPDMREGTAAFLEKRQAEFPGS